MTKTKLKDILAMNIEWSENAVARCKDQDIWDEEWETGEDGAYTGLWERRIAQEVNERLARMLKFVSSLVEQLPE